VPTFGPVELRLSARSSRFDGYDAAACVPQPLFWKVLEGGGVWLRYRVQME
jgi:hypothetical protein